MGICLILKWFTIQMPGTMEVQYSDHHLVIRLVLRPPFLYSDARYHGTVYLNNEQVKVCYSNVATIQIPNLTEFSCLRFIKPVYILAQAYPSR